MEEKVAICKREIDTDVNTIFTEKTLRDDKVLTDHIIQYAEKIKADGGEVFKQQKNIIATTEGYFFAFYINELNVI